MILAVVVSSAGLAFRTALTTSMRSGSHNTDYETAATLATAQSSRAQRDFEELCVKNRRLQEELVLLGTLNVDAAAADEWLWRCRPPPIMLCSCVSSRRPPAYFFSCAQDHGTHAERSCIWRCAAAICDRRREPLLWTSRGC